MKIRTKVASCIIICVLAANLSCLNIAHAETMQNQYENIYTFAPVLTADNSLLCGVKETKEQNSILYAQSCAATDDEEQETKSDESDLEKKYNKWNADYKEFAQNICEEKEIDYSLLLAIIYNESKFKSEATHLNTNGTTDWGLMQINDSCFDFLSKRIRIKSMNELLDPYTNIKVGAELLSYYTERSETREEILGKYQLGEGTYAKLKESGKTPTELETKVLEYADEYEIICS